MSDTINGRTPEEIMRRMECWNRYYAGECNDGNRSFELRIQQCAECETRVPGYRIEDAFRDVWEYAKQLERERDAAVSDMTEIGNACGTCYACKYWDEKHPTACDRFLNGMDCWQWRGAQEG